MSYITISDITGFVPGPFLNNALDDSEPQNDPPQADPTVLNKVLQDASNAVDKIIGTKFSTPFSNPLPAAVHNAARWFAIELIYQRRGKADANPYAKHAEDARTHLAAIAAGTMPLNPSRSAAKSTAAPAAK